VTTEATTTAEIQALITADHLTVSYGLRVLDGNDALVEDISDYFLGGTIEYHRDATVHRSARLFISQERTWATERFQPYQTLTSDTYHRTWYLGVFVPSVPEVDYGDDPVTYSVECLDKLCLLDRPIGDNYLADAAEAYIDEVAVAITASGATGIGNIIEESALAEVLATDMVWLLDPNQPETWKNVCDDLLAAIGYNPLWCDGNGYFCSEPYQDNADLTGSWTFDLSDTDTQIVMEPRTFYKNEYNKTNQYRFVRDGMDTVPTEGAGYCTVTVRGAGYCTVTVSDDYYAVGGSETTDGGDTIRTFNSSGSLYCVGTFGLSYLVAAGGGGGGGASGGGGAGGGGGGEVLTGNMVVSGETLTVTVGAGGSGGAAGANNGGYGEDSVLGTVTADGGGYGGAGTAPGANGGTGGNGGGGGNGNTTTVGVGGTGDQYDGGDGAYTLSGGYYLGVGGGGGGAGSDGDDGTAPDLTGHSGNGGLGLYSNISGGAAYYGGGGGGGQFSSFTGTVGIGGLGGGGVGGDGDDGTAGTANLGGGGGGGGRLSGVADKAGGAGGSGVVIVRYTTPDIDTIRREVIYLDAVDQATLEAAAVKWVANNIDARETMTIKTGPWPIAGHNQVVQYVDADADIDGLCAVVGWRLDLAGAPVDLELEVVN